MLKSIIERFPAKATCSIVLISVIIMGSFIGYMLPQAGEWIGQGIDYTIIALVACLLFGVRFNAFIQVTKNLKFLVIVHVTNFIIVPLLGYALAYLFLMPHPLMAIGLIIYFMAPCTDWFLSFTRLTGGNVALGAALIPINMIIQLLLYPLFINLFAHKGVQVDISTLSSTLLVWFVLPFAIAVGLYYVLSAVLTGTQLELTSTKVDQATAWLTAFLVFQIFSANVLIITEYGSVFPRILLAIFTFFLFTFLLSEGISRIFRLAHPEHALLVMTVAARNAPLMLAVTMIALPNQPLVYATIVIGMLIELPHLTLLQQVLINRHGRSSLEKGMTTTHRASNEQSGSQAGALDTSQAGDF